MTMAIPLARLRGDTRGAIAIETAIVAPVLVLLGLGSFDVSQMVSRQSDLQSAAAEAEAIVQAAVPTDAAARDKVRDILKASIDPDDTNPNDTETVSEIYRCGTGVYQTALPTCATGSKLSTYIKIALTDLYTPNWTSFGVGHPIAYAIVRTVQIS
jgi:Flp pilus assembly protein TadG